MTSNSIGPHLFTRQQILCASRYFIYIDTTNDLLSALLLLGMMLNRKSLSIILLVVLYSNSDTIIYFITP